MTPSPLFLWHLGLWVHLRTELFHLMLGGRQNSARFRVRRRTALGGFATSIIGAVRPFALDCSTTCSVVNSERQQYQKRPENGTSFLVLRCLSFPALRTVELALATEIVLLYP